jgi:hypothetical protein
MVFNYDSASHRLTISALAEGAAQGNIKQPKAHWVSASNTIAWEITEPPGNTYLLHYTPTGGETLSLEPDGVIGGASLPLTVDRQRPERRNQGEIPPSG